MIVVRKSLGVRDEEWMRACHTALWWCKDIQYLDTWPEATDILYVLEAKGCKGGRAELIPHVDIHEAPYKL
jgi:hypothetical protein